MTKQIEVYSRRVQLYSLDGGHTWSSSLPSIVAYGQRQKRLRLELQKSFECTGEFPDPDPNRFAELEMLISIISKF